MAFKQPKGCSRNFCCTIVQSGASLDRRSTTGLPGAFPRVRILVSWYWWADGRRASSLLPLCPEHHYAPDRNTGFRKALCVIDHNRARAAAGSDRRMTSPVSSPSRTRTGTPVRARDFKSPASAIPPRGHRFTESYGEPGPLLPHWAAQGNRRFRRARSRGLPGVPAGAHYAGDRNRTGGSRARRSALLRVCRA